MEIMDIPKSDHSDYKSYFYIVERQTIAIKDSQTFKKSKRYIRRFQIKNLHKTNPST